ncbi:hypothetical protein HMPREF0290_0224 [Corynebacterium efficiens YS-314]|nr:hypothetical protein HMPREF0290_0224 [Corynebacterium efficiens YS-314]
MRWWGRRDPTTLSIQLDSSIDRLVCKANSSGVICKAFSRLNSSFLQDIDRPVYSIHTIATLKAPAKTI